MNSFLLIIKNTADHEEKAYEFCQKLSIEKIDITIINATPDKNQKSSEKGIGLIRKIIGSISLKPIRSDKKAVIVLYSDKLSIPAQNALLKTLEEPPSDTVIILTAESEFSLLSTIRSRCQIIKKRAETEDKAVDKERLDLKGLEKAEFLAKDKTKALNYLKNEIKILESSLLVEAESNSDSNSIFETKKKLSDYLETYQLIKSTNVNLRLCLENLFLTEI